MTYLNSSEHAKASKPAFAIYIGLAIVTMVTMMYELLLTRIFSVCMWYHFAFMAVSMAMFGITAGALVVYFRPGAFKDLEQSIWQHCQWFSLTIFAALILFRFLPLYPEFSGRGFLSLSACFALFGLPFVFSGIVCTLCLTKFGKSTKSLYAADLVGAAAGCPLLIVLLNVLDAAGACLCLALGASLAATLIGARFKSRLGFSACLSLLLALVLFSCIDARAKNQPSLDFRYAKNLYIGDAEFSKWNSYSLVRVSAMNSEPFGWGLSKRYKQLYPEGHIEQKFLDIDVTAGTPITKFAGNLEELSHLRYDIINLAHYLRPVADVAVVGVGGGRDLLSSLAFRQRSVLGIELNEIIYDLLKNKYADFNGQLAKNPKVRVVNSEARSYLANHNQKFDIIQISLTDTWAASSAGAYVLSENTLYTKEAFSLFLERLKPGGILSCSRWYELSGPPVEFYRLVSLGLAALKDNKLEKPEECLLAIATKFPHSPQVPEAVVTLLLSPRPFSASDLEMLNHLCSELDFQILIAPGQDSKELSMLLGDQKQRAEFASSLVANIEATTDDSPFFFNMVKAEKLFQPGAWKSFAAGGHQIAVGVLLVSAILSTISFLICLTPLLVSTKRGGALKAGILYFVLIGLAFIFVEIASLERLTVFLGHPVYGLSTVLFALLLGTALGSAAVPQLMLESNRGRLILALSTVLCTAGSAYFLFFVLDLSWQMSQWAKIAVALAAVLIPGIFMGTLFPSGMEILKERQNESYAPWFWGLNGAASVLATFLALLFSMFLGIKYCYFAGSLLYLVAACNLYYLQSGEPDTAKTS